MPKEHLVLGVDIGGTGIKGAIVNLNSGEFVTERLRLDTPQPSTPKAVGIVLKQLVKELGWEGKVGIGFPAIVKNGTALSAANIHKSWKGKDIESFFSKQLGRPVAVINDADAAGLAAKAYGVGRDHKGLLIFLTIGTGIGSAMFFNEQLIPNSELGHLYLKRKIAEKSVSKTALINNNLSIEEWGANWNKFLKHIERILSPDLFVLGGGGSKRFDEMAPHISIETPVIVSQLRNNAGIIGAAYYAQYGRKPKSFAKEDTSSSA